MSGSKNFYTRCSRFFTRVDIAPGHNFITDYNLGRKRSHPTRKAVFFIRVFQRVGIFTEVKSAACRELVAFVDKDDVFI